MSASLSYKDMPVWQQSMRLAAGIFQLTSEVSTIERLGLEPALQHAATNIPTQLASGSKAGKTGFRSAVAAARQSAAELETLLLLTQQMIDDAPIDTLLTEAGTLQTALSNLARRLGEGGAAGGTSAPAV